MSLFFLSIIFSNDETTIVIVLSSFKQKTRAAFIVLIGKMSNYEIMEQTVILFLFKFTPFDIVYGSQ